MIVNSVMSAAILGRMHVANVGKRADEQDTSIYAESVQTSFPFAPDGHTTSLKNRDELVGFLARIGEFTSGHSIRDLVIQETETGFVIHYVESSVFNLTNNAYSSPILWLGKVDGGVIVSLCEYYNPVAVLEALGE